MQRRLHVDLEFRRRVAKKKPLITARQKKKRLKYAKVKIKWTKEKWRRVLFSDEAMFRVTGNRATHVYRRPGPGDPNDPKYTCATIKQPDRLMVWGSFGYHGPGELRVLPRNERMNKEKYLVLISDHLMDCFVKCRIPLRNGICQQDGATCHTAKIIGEYLDFVNVDYINERPGNSPDSNPIEHIWAQMKHQLRGRDTSSLPKLEAEIRDIWANLDPDYLKTLVDSVPDRLQ